MWLFFIAKKPGEEQIAINTFYSLNRVLYSNYGRFLYEFPSAGQKPPGRFIQGNLLRFILAFTI